MFLNFLKFLSFKYLEIMSKFEFRDYSLIIFQIRKIEYFEYFVECSIQLS